jgi:hypothetical protein
MRVLEIPDMLRKYDVEPVVMADFKTAGNEYPDRPEGALRHWTAGSTRLGIPSLATLRFGRSDLPGPLCAVGQERADPSKWDRAYCIASGKANHAGAGNWHGLDSNYDLLGLEIEWAGPTEAFSSKRRDVSERIMRALLDCCDNPANNAQLAAEHREYALPAGRKIDTNLSGDTLRRRMAELRTQYNTPKPEPKPEPVPEEDDDMPKPLLLRLNPKDPAVLYMSSARTVHWVKSGEALQGYKFDMQNNGLSPDVCVLSATDEAGMLEELHDFVVNLPFIGDWPKTSTGASTGTKEAWKGAHIPSTP